MRSNWRSRGSVTDWTDPPVVPAGRRRRLGRRTADRPAAVVVRLAAGSSASAASTASAAASSRPPASASRRGSALGAPSALGARRLGRRVSRRPAPRPRRRARPRRPRRSARPRARLRRRRLGLGLGSASARLGLGLGFGDAGFGCRRRRRRLGRLGGLGFGDGSASAASARLRPSTASARRRLGVVGRLGSAAARPRRRLGVGVGLARLGAPCAAASAAASCSRTCANAAASVLSIPPSGSWTASDERVAALAARSRRSPRRGPALRHRAGAAAASGAGRAGGSSACLRLRPRRWRSESSEMILSLSAWPSWTTSPGWATRWWDSSLMWIRPSRPSRTRTNAPKLTSFVTVPSMTSPTLKSATVECHGSGWSRRIDRLIRPRSWLMSMTSASTSSPTL